MKIKSRHTALVASMALVAPMIGVATIQATADDSVDLASDPVTVECSVMCYEDELTAFVEDAGSTPTKIVLGAINTKLNETLVIPAGSDITFVNAPPLFEGFYNDFAVVRGDEFPGTLIKIEEGAKLTLDTLGVGPGAVNVGARGKSLKALSSLDPSIVVEGELVMNDGMVHGARRMFDAHEGAITVRGENAKFTLNDGAVTDNERFVKTDGDGYDPGAAQSGAGNIALVDGATMVMNGDEVSNGATTYHPYAYGEAGGIGVYRGAHLIINGGKITNNGGWAGNIGVYNWLNKSDIPTAETTRSTVEINGGEISNGFAYFGGGGINILGNGEVVMKDGLITGNKALGTNGGGVNAMDMYVQGAKYTWEEIPGDGMIYGYSPEEWSKISPAAFKMYGGTISNNSAERTGGGVNIVSNGVELLGGVIEGNHSDDQGGGVYVATPSYTAHLRNALITGNKAEKSYDQAVALGGGIWLCPTGDLKMHVTDGAAVFDNEAPDAAGLENHYPYGDDIAHDNLGTADPAELKLDSLMLGAGNTSYFKDGGYGMPRYDESNPGKQQVFHAAPTDPIEGDPNLNLDEVDLGHPFKTLD